MKRLAVDTGGTFTDFVLSENGDITRLKLPSTPDDPARSIVEGVKKLGLDPREPFRLTHGTTAATNALLERKGARTLLITTPGFEDVLEIGRQERPDIFALAPVIEPVLIPAGDRLGLKGERMGIDGVPLSSPDEKALAELPKLVKQGGYGAVAICFLHSYMNPAHELAALNALNGCGVPVSASHRVCPEPREYERALTTAVNAYLSPVMSSYLNELKKNLPGAQILIMQSSGNLLGVENVDEFPVRCLLSGPTGGLHAAPMTEEGSISLDMGGTSTDVGLVVRKAGEDLHLEYMQQIDGLPLMVPSARIETIGAGGGSIAALDLGGALIVGPESAGADPGPACYGRGEKPTVTDANLILGRFGCKGLLGGEFKLDKTRAEKAVGALAEEMGVDIEAAAEGIVEVACRRMAQAIRVVVAEGRRDPTLLSLVPFGGAGALHAAGIMEALEMQRALIPPHPGLFSAEGIRRAPVVYHHTIRINAPLSDFEPPDTEEEYLDRYVRPALKELDLAGSEAHCRLVVDLKYRGQSHHLPLRFGYGETVKTLELAFHRRHNRIYGFRHIGHPVDACCLRLVISLEKGLPGEFVAGQPFNKQADFEGGEKHKIRFEGEWIEGRSYAREELKPGMGDEGPLSITDYSSCIFVPPRWRIGCREDGWLEMWRAGRGVAS